MNKKYYKLHDDEYDIFPRYIEIDEKCYALREVVEFPAQTKNTSLCIDDNFFLSEGSWEKVLEEIQENEISPALFEEKWEKSKEKHFSAWEEIKRKFTIGHVIERKNSVFLSAGNYFRLWRKIF